MIIHSITIRLYDRDEEKTKKAIGELVSKLQELDVYDFEVDLADGVMVKK